MSLSVGVISWIGPFAKRLRATMPAGSQLPERLWARRHRGILVVLWLHAIGIACFSLYTGNSWRHSLFEGGIVALTALAAALRTGHRTTQASLAAFGLIASSAMLVHLSGGYIEFHFHFFVMVGLMALYQEWAPFLVAIGFVLLHHGVVGVLDPSDVYNHAAAMAHPWRWAALHAAFIAAMSAVSLTTWRLSENARADAEQRLRETQTLLAVSQALSSTLDLTEMLRRVARETGRALGADTVGAYLTEPDGTTLRATAGHHVPATRLDEFRAFAIPVRGHRFVEEAVEGGEPVWSSEARVDPRIDRALLARFQHRSVLFTPMIRSGHLIGGIYAVWWTEPRRFSQDERRVVSGIARQAAVAVANVRLHEESERRRQAAESLVNLGRIISRSLDAEEVAQRIVDSVSKLYDAESAAVYLLDEDSGDLITLAVRGSRTPLAKGTRVPRGTGTVGRAVRDRVPVVSDDVHTDPRAGGTTLAVPLIASERIVGALAVSQRAGWRVDEEQVRLAELFAATAALALENARLYGETQRRLKVSETLQRRLEALLEATRQLSSIQPLETLLQKIAEACGRLLGTDSVGLRLVEGDELVVAGMSGDASEIMTRRLRIGESLSGFVAKTGEPLVVPDLATDPRVIEAHRAPLMRSGYRGWLGVPVKVGDRTAGVLSIRTRRESGFSAEDVSIALAFASQAATSLENTRLYEEVRHAYDQLSLTQEQLTQAQKMEAVGRLAGGVAHDFNNLLSIITGRAALLRNRLESDSPLQRHADLIQKTAGRAADLTQQLLAFSRKQVLQPKVLDLNGLVGSFGSMLRRLIGEDIDLLTVLGPTLAPVTADPGQLEQVLMNLVVNARDAMPGGGRVTLETANVVLDASYAARHPDVQAGPHVLLAVSDTGTGMDAATREHMFEPFFTTKGPGKGTGLGLATVYGIVKQSGGHVSVYSEVGHGTTFKIYLPAVAQALTTTEEPAPASAPRGSETVLLVEDEAELRELLAEVLEDNGYTVLKAGDGAEAATLCAERERVIDLLLTDVVMPGMSGRELVDRVQPLRPAMKVLYMSGYTDGAIVHHGVLEPGIAFIQKPFAPPAIAHKVRDVLDGSLLPAGIG
jgi:signal transduction histidine kinase